MIVEKAKNDKCDDDEEEDRFEPSHEATSFTRTASQIFEAKESSIPVAFGCEIVNNTRFQLEFNRQTVSWILTFK
jgi:hypothetical protein